MIEGIPTPVNGNGRIAATMNPQARFSGIADIRIVVEGIGEIIEKSLDFSDSPMTFGAIARMAKTSAKLEFADRIPEDWKLWKYRATNFCPGHNGTAGTIEVCISPPRRRHKK